MRVPWQVRVLAAMDSLGLDVAHVAAMPEDGADASAAGGHDGHALVALPAAIPEPALPDFDDAEPNFGA